MRSQTKENRRPLNGTKLKSGSFRKRGGGNEDLNDIIQKISIEKVSLEKRREEAQKPLYLVRYE